MVKNSKRNDTEEDGGRHVSLQSLHVWYQAMLEKYDKHYTANNTIDTKAGIILAAAIAVATFAGASVGGLDSVGLLLGIGIAGLIVVSVLNLVCLRIRTTFSPVSTTAEQSDYYNRSDEEFIWHLISDLEHAIEAEVKASASKVSLYNVSSVLFVVSSVAIILSKVVDVTIILK